MLVIPQVIEQALAGLALARTGAGLTMGEDRSPETCKAMLDRLLNDKCYASAALGFAQKYAGFSVEAVTGEQIKRIDRLIGN